MRGASIRGGKQRAGCEWGRATQVEGFLSKRDADSVSAWENAYICRELMGKDRAWNCQVVNAMEPILRITEGKVKVL